MFLYADSAISEIKWCSKETIRPTVTMSEIGNLITYFKDKYVDTNTEFPNINLNDSNVCAYYPMSGCHRIDATRDNELLFSSQMYVFINKQKYRYMFNFTIIDVDKEKLLGMKKMSDLFEGREMAQYYLSRINDEKNTNPIELIEIKSDTADNCN